MNNGNGKILKIIGGVVAVVGIISGLVTWGANHVIANDQASRSRDTIETKERVATDISIRDEIGEGFLTQEIKLTKIMTKLGIE